MSPGVDDERLRRGGPADDSDVRSLPVPREPRRIGAGVLVALGCAFAVVFAARKALVAFEAHTPFVVDDAYITLRYARHIAEGLGPVWNPGERVEGYTSFLAVALIALLHRLGAGLEAAALAVNAAGLATLVAIVLAHGARVHRGLSRFPSALAPALVVLAYPPMHVWLHGRLEGPLFAGLVALALHATTRLLEAPGRVRLEAFAALSLGLLPLVRPDGGVFGVIGALFVLGAYVRARGAAGIRGYARFAALALLLPVAHVAFRRIYYGEWVPNTVIAKTTGVRDELLVEAGLEYLKKFLEARPYFVQVALAALPFGLIDRVRRLPVAFLVASAGGYIALIVAAGGDHMAAHRLLLPAVAPLALLWAEGLHGLASLRTRPDGAAAALATSVAAGLLFGLVPGERYRVAERPDPAAYVGTVVGEHLAATYPKGALVALHTAGSTPYFAPELRFIDMLGLNDAHIARRRVDRFETFGQRWPGHAKGDGAYVLERAPDVIVLGPAEGTTPARPWFLSDVELARDPRFAERYRVRETTVDVSRRPHHGDVPATRRGRLKVRLYERVDTDAVRPGGSPRAAP